MTINVIPWPGEFAMDSLCSLTTSVSQREENVDVSSVNVIAFMLEPVLHVGRWVQDGQY
jgi:hypothetical protein